MANYSQGANEHFTDEQNETIFDVLRMNARSLWFKLSVERDPRKQQELKKQITDILDKISQLEPHKRRHKMREQEDQLYVMCLQTEQTLQAINRRLESCETEKNRMTVEKQKICAKLTAIQKAKELTAKQKNILSEIKLIDELIKKTAPSEAGDFRAEQASKESILALNQALQGLKNDNRETVKNIESLDEQASVIESKTRREKMLWEQNVQDMKHLKEKLDEVQAELLKKDLRRKKNERDKSQKEEREKSLSPLKRAKPPLYQVIQKKQSVWQFKWVIIALSIWSLALAAF